MTMAWLAIAVEHLPHPYWVAGRTLKIIQVQVVLHKNDDDNDKDDNNNHDNMVIVMSRCGRREQEESDIPYRRWQAEKGDPWTLLSHAAVEVVLAV